MKVLVEMQAFEPARARLPMVAAKPAPSNSARLQRVHPRDTGKNVPQP
jgi:hypothetical protein